MKVCLVNPPVIMSTRHPPPSPFYPMGLLYVAATIEKEHRVSIIDAPAEGWRNLHKIRIDGEQKYYLGLEFKQIARKIEDERPDVVGITVPFSISHWSAHRVASIAKEVNRDIVTILGGHHPSVRPDNVLSHPVVDFVVVGEGEHTMQELLDRLEQGRHSDLKQVRGIAYRSNGKIRITSPRPLIPDLNALPFPARHLLPMTEYFAASKSGKLYRGQSYIPKGAKWATVITSRGCPFSCVFCAIHLTMGKKWRARSPENVVQEIEHLVSTYKINHVCFEDDNMTLDKERAKQICDLMIERGVDITWSMPNGVRADTLDEELIRKMKQAGCTQVFVAPESGDQRVVDQIIKKRQDLLAVKEAVRLFKKYGISVDANFVIGFIGETKEDIQRSLRFAYCLRKSGAGIAAFIAIPLYGTELYENAAKKGYLRRTINDMHLDSTEPLIETPEFTSDELLEFRNQFLMLNPLPDIFRLALDHPAMAMRYIFSPRTWVSLIKMLRLLASG